MDKVKRAFKGNLV